MKQSTSLDSLGFTPLPAICTLKTKRLILRGLELADRQAVYDIFSDKAVIMFYNQPLMRRLSQADEYILRSREASFGGWQRMHWGIALAGSNHVVGTCELHDLNEVYHSCSIGFALATKYWGQGLMPEALSAVLTVVFDQNMINRMQAHVVPENQPCIAMLRRLGFVEEGLLRQYGHWNDRYHDCLSFSMLRADWCG